MDVKRKELTTTKEVPGDRLGLSEWDLTPIAWYSYESTSFERGERTRWFERWAFTWDTTRPATTNPGIRQNMKDSENH